MAQETPVVADALTLARSRWQGLKELLEDPEGYDPDLVLADALEFPLLKSFLREAFLEHPEEVRAIVREMFARQEELDRVLGIKLEGLETLL